MQVSKKKTIAVTFALFLMLTITLNAMPLAFAHDPPWEIPTYAYIAVSPSPVGVGQDTFVFIWVDKVPPTAGGIGGDRWTGMTVVITKPDGTTETKGPYTSDATSSAAFTYTPNQVGTYKFVFNFPNNVATGINPTNGIPYDPAVAMFGAAYINDTYLASTATTTLIVQDEPVLEPPTYPLPTEYWTRPIEGQNTAWSTIASNWLGGGNINDRVQPNGVAPNSPHVMWTKPLTAGGIVGGTFQDNVGVYYQGLSYEGRWGTPIIINGKLYYDTPLSDDPNDGAYTCVDLRTGETLWTNPDISPTFGQLYYYESFNQHGVIGDGYLWQVAGTTWRAYDPATGNSLFNMTDVPSGFGPSFLGGYGSGAVGPSGEILIYVLNNANHWLALWNSSASLNSPLVLTPGVGTNAYQYRPIGKTANMSKEYTWNVTIPALPPGSAIVRAIPGDLVLGFTGFSSFLGFGTPDPYYFWALSLEPGSEGTLLWQKSYSPPAGNKTLAFGSIDTLGRVFTLTEKETMQWLGYDLDSGEKLWGPLGDFRDFQYYGIVSHPPAPSYSAYGLTYVGGYGGEIHAFESRTGTLVWIYNSTFSAHETPWGNYPLYIAAIADGKIYAFTSEHSPNLPQYKGSLVRCINATTGEEIWTLSSWYAIGSFGEEAMPVADGYITYMNTYDMQIYCIGKGPSATTVTAPDVGIAVGQSVMIRGTVTDTAAGTKQAEQAARFPNGVPAVSDESMRGWMEYVYMQKPSPADVTGVPVTIDVIDANNNYRNIGTATTDAFGTYSLMWTPDITGKYTVIATFPGSEAYYTSFASTSFGVDEAPEPTVAPTPGPASIADQYFIPMSIGIIAAIAIVGIAILLMLRRK